MSPAKKIGLIKLFVLLVSLYGATLFYVYTFQRSIIFQPSSENPFLQNYAPFKTFTYQTPLGLTLRGMWVPPKGNQPTIIFFHGNGGNLSHRYAKAKALTSYGYGIALVGYRGYSGNPGVPTETNLYEDARAAIAALQQKGLMKRDIVLYGESLGSGVAVQMATEMPNILAVILEAPYTSIIDVAASRYWFLPVRKLGVTDKFENDMKIGSLKIPVLIIHGDDDSVVPIRFGKKLFEAIKTPLKKFAEIDGGTHHNLYEHNAGGVIHDFLVSVE